MTIPVPRFGHGSRVPGWDEAVDLTKDPALVPDPALTPVPEELRRDDRGGDGASTRTRRSAAIPALHAAQEEHGWCSPEAIDQVACVMQLTPAYLTSVATFYDMLESCTRSPATTCSCARTSPARCAAPTSSTRR